MTTFATSVASNAELRRERAAPMSHVHEWIVFWLPVFVIGVAVFLLDHSFASATLDYWNAGGARDLVVEAGSSNAVRQASIAVLGVMGAILLFTRSRTPIHADVWLMSLVVAMCTMVVLSALWAEDSIQSLKRSSIPVLLAVAALGVGKHWQPRQLYVCIVTLTMTYLLIGVAAAGVAGTLFPTNDSRFTGTTHPNIQGVNCALLSLASLMLFWTSYSPESQRRNWRWLVPSFIGLGFLLLTGSRTATLAFAAAIAVLLIFGASARVKLLAAMGALFVAAVIGVLSLDTEAIQGDLTHRMVQMGREQDMSEAGTLSGRIPIWEMVIQDVAEQPFLGYGYGGFWTPRKVFEYSHIHNWEFNHAHSAYLEILLGVGIVGLTLGLVLVVSSAITAFGVFRRTEDVGFLFITALLVFALIHGVLDTNLVTAGFASLLAMICISIVTFHRHNLTTG